MSYHLSTSDLDPLLQAIEQRFEEARPRPVQRLSSKLLLLTTFALVLIYLVYLTTGEALILQALACVGLQVLFALLSWRYLPVVKRQRRLYRELDLIAPDPTPGMVFKRRSSNEQALVRAAVGAVVAGVLGAIALNSGTFSPKELPPLIGMICLVLGTAYFVWSDRKIPLATIETLLLWIKYALLIWLAVLGFLLWQQVPGWQDWFGTLLAVLWPAWLLVKSRQVVRIEERFAPMGGAGGLREALVRSRKQATESGSDSVALEPDEVAQLGYAEREMIRQARVDAIDRTRSEDAELCPVFVADELNLQLRRLEPTDRLAVQEAISKLSALGTAEGSEASGTIEVAGTSLSLRYLVEEVPRRVTARELVSHEPGHNG